MSKAHTAPDCGLLSAYRAEIFGVAILWVMLFHSYLCGVTFFRDIPVLCWVGEFIEYGNMGVDIFLFLSGIGLYFSFQRQQALLPYLRRRLLRVYPALFAVDGLYWLGLLLFGKQTLPATLLSFSGLRFWFDGNQDVWYAALILVLYPLFPFVYAVLYRDNAGRGVLRRTLLLTAAVMLLLWSVSQTPGAKAFYDSTEIALNRFPVFLLGCGCGKLVRDRRRLPRLWWAAALALAALCFAGLASGSITGIWRRWYYLLGGVPLAFLTAGLMKVLPEAVRRAFRWLGDMSLELYLSHLMIRRLYYWGVLPFAYEPGNPWKYLLVLVLGVIWAWIARRVTTLLLQRREKSKKPE